MDTTQKPREERPARPSAPAESKGRTRPAEAPARNGKRRPDAVRSEQTARPAPRRTGKQEEPARRNPRPAGKSPAGTGSKTRKKPSPAGKAPAKRRPAGKDPEDISQKKRAYGKSKPKKKSAIVLMAENVQKSLKKTREKRNKGKSDRPKQPTPAVIYTQPAAFNRNRLLIQLTTVAAVVMALVIGLSVFFKVEHIYVSGAKVYSESSITEVCGISKGDNLLTFSHARAAALIRANRPYVREVRFGIKLPDTVNIIIEEDDVAYAIKDQTGQWWLMNSNGRVVEQGNNSKVANTTQVLGVTLDNPVPDERAVALESTPEVSETSNAADATAETNALGVTEPAVTPVTTTGAQRLSAALQILQALEENDIVGSAASVDVSRIDDIILWYGTRYQVNLGDSTRLDYKIACMNSVIAQMSEYQSGILDVSFTIWTTQVGYTPFA